MESEKVIIHARFAPNGTVVEISERPGGLTAQEWFDVLSDKTSNAYQSLAGGRGVFRLTRAEIDALKPETTATAA
jgi:hypothetical protein